jgi:Putative MetA-pathway of phenol degradation
VASYPLFAGVASAACALTFSSAVAGERCASDTIATDRPDVTNSSVVVPLGTFQSENGLDLENLRTAKVFEGTESRLRLGIATCLELLVDVPSYSLGVGGDAPSGFSNLAPAIKWQLGRLPGEIDLSVTAGAGLPTGRVLLVGRGVQPYLQIPWSRELADGWGVSGMLTAFFSPANAAGSAATQSTFAIERELGHRTDVFIEYAGEFRSHDQPSHLLNVGGAFRLTPRQQLDFHVAGGLTRSAPSYAIGVGYSIRLDGLF